MRPLVEDSIQRIEQIIQRDVNHRGLDRNPHENLFTACAGDLLAACRSLGGLAEPDNHVAIVTGFWISDAKALETDGPIGALFLAKVLSRLGDLVSLAIEPRFRSWFETAMEVLKINYVQIIPMQSDRRTRGAPPGLIEAARDGGFTHVIAVERPGPTHTFNTFRAQRRSGPAPAQEFLDSVPGDHWDKLHSMRGQIVAEGMDDVSNVFDRGPQKWGAAATIGIGDGGNEIGMGKVPWETIARNVPDGGRIACRVAADYNIVAGVSNWGAYALAAGTWMMRRRRFAPKLFDPDVQRVRWERIIETVPLVDGITGKRGLSIDGLSWKEHNHAFEEIAAVMENHYSRASS